MKKISLFLAALLISIFSAYADSDRITHDINELPEKSRLFLSTYYKNIPISHIKIEKNLLWIESYDVILTNGTNIEFERSGEWKEVKGSPEHIPSTIIQAFIHDYVNQHYAGTQISGVDRSGQHIEIDLNNGIELTFDTEGHIIDIDR